MNFSKKTDIFNRANESCTIGFISNIHSTSIRLTTRPDDSKNVNRIKRVKPTLAHFEGALLIRIPESYANSNRGTTHSKTKDTWPIFIRSFLVFIE